MRINTVLESTHKIKRIHNISKYAKEEEKIGELEGGEIQVSATEIIYCKKFNIMEVYLI